MCKNTIKARPV
uniref:Uncharacterized protein n=1 Tax=Anguilla anguilla TaxID=7936 RepID=A0A0E9VAK7_ANGAN